MEWSPTTQDELESLIHDELGACTEKQREIFNRYKVPLRKAPIVRYGKQEYVFVVAQRGDEVMYYEDVEEGFNFSPLAEDGSIKEHWCNQDELEHALNRWILPENELPPKLGPAEPIQ